MFKQSLFMKTQSIKMKGEHKTAGTVDLKPFLKVGRSRPLEWQTELSVLLESCHVARRIHNQ